MKRSITMTKEQAEAHQARHGFPTIGGGRLPHTPWTEPVKVPKPRQNQTEREYGLILEAQKQRGEILDYRPFGIKLEWGCDPVTGKPMVYSPDFVVFDKTEGTDWPFPALSIRFIETKGYVRPKDLVRWKGCRSDWPMFRFELYQKADGEWRRLF